MKIIEHGDTNKRKTCRKCKCIFEYDLNDIKENVHWEREDVGILLPRYESFRYVDKYVYCPDCGDIIYI